MTDAERLLERVREFVRQEIYPTRQSLGAIGLGNFFTRGRLNKKQRRECWALMERLLGANAMLIELLGIDRYVWGRDKLGEPAARRSGAGRQG